MKQFLKRLGIGLVLYGFVLYVGIAQAVQISVPSAPSAGYMLVSTSTGAYIATTTSPLMVGAINATTTTATSTIAGNLVVGYNGAAITETGVEYLGKVKIASDDTDVGAATIYERNATNCPLLGCGIWNYRSRGDRTTKTAVIADDYISSWYNAAHDGTDYEPAAAILAQVDGTPGNNDMPGRLQFLTTADGSNTLTERMRITNAGNVGIGTTSPASLLHVGGFNTTNSTMRAGSLEFQPYSLNNGFINENTYYNSGFKYRNTGYAGMFYFYLGEGQFRFFDTGTAGASLPSSGNNVQFKVRYTGDVGIGGTMSASANNFTGAALMVKGTTGYIGVATTSPMAALSLGSGQLIVPSGSLSAPSIGFSAEPNTGIYRNAAAGFAFVGAGSLIADFTNSRFTTVGQIRGPDGSAAFPSHSFTNNTGLGMYNGSSGSLNSLDFAAGGGTMFRMQNQNITEFIMNATTTTGQVNFSHAQNGTRRFTTYVAGSSPSHFYSIYHYGISKDVLRIPGAEAALMMGTTTQRAVFTMDGSGSGYGHSVSTPLMNLYGLPGLTAPYLNIYDGSWNSVLTVNSSGNMGLGTSTPYSRLHVSSGANATTTTTIGEIGLTTSKGCVNMNRADGGAGSFYLNAAGTLVSEANYCR